MSDAMTNREIEDVLTSIRRLVAQDGARPGDRPEGEGPAPRPAGKLILTEAQRIDAAAPEAPAQPAPVVAISPAPAPEPAPTNAALPAPDFSRLEATIAELEAAVSASGGTWEGELAEDAPRASNVTDLYGRLHFGPRRDAPTPAPAPAPQPEPVAETPAPAPTLRVGPAPEPAPPELARLAAEPADPADLAIETPVTPEPPSPPQETRDSDAVFQLPAADSVPPSPADTEGEAILDEAALYALVAQIVREELHGQLGERITAQVRKLVRAEIAKALDERKFL